MAASTTTIQNLHINHLISVKLDETNCLLWLTQFKPLLKGYNLQGYIDGTLPCPPRTLPDSTEVNPDFTKWEEQDQILLGWLLSSLSDTILSRLVGLSTSREVWSALEKRFAPKTCAHHMHLRRELQTLRKGNKTMQQYFSYAKQLFDALVASGNPITDNDL
ncbi:hypothetical protein BVC80_1149g1 [Macleaya cordata]|uniref:Retrotransposon Copia-like N-terminal domain-containing protein n=1 Tax=Macleaya cordata TaxID=56857 RepID=A0A200QWG3_MACCD|nr:hypothetical protein BVC80_1149g1 [Macleaya cordata]